MVTQPAPTATTMRRALPKSAGALITGVAIAALVLLGLYQVQPPSVVAASAPPTQFSAERALRHVQVIARRPHFAGSPENARVRDYLLDQLRSLGLEPEVQTTSISIYFPRAGSRAGTVNNVMARLPGTAPTKALVLVAHYDSVRMGPGASDAAAGVAAVLETLRALRTGPALKNDVIAVFTDGEEAGLLGARAFVEEHPWSRDVGVVLNLEARGAGGASLMFETSPSNGWLIRQFAMAAPDAVSTSLMGDIYRQLPNATDLTVFNEAGFSGLNFAYGGRWPAYHTVLDTVQNLDPRSLQHHGSYTLALARHFGNISLLETTGADAVYFTLFGRGFHYPRSWVLPLTGVIAVLFAGSVLLGLGRRRLTLLGMLLGAFALLPGAIASGALVTAVWLGVEDLWAGSMELNTGAMHDSHLLALSFVALGIAIIATLYRWLRTRISLHNLTGGALLVWLCLLVTSSIALPGASYLFAWPLLGGLVGLGAMIVAPASYGFRTQFLLGLLPAIPGILLVGPMIYLLFEFLPAMAYGAVTVVLGLLLILLAPHLDLMVGPRRSWLPGVAGALSAALLIASGATAGYDRDRPRPNSVFYSMNADTGKAIWASLDRQPDLWTSQFLSTVPQPGTAAEALLVADPRPILKREAPPLALPAPTVDVREDTTSGDVRTVKLQVSAPQTTWALAAGTGAETELVGVAVDGEPLNGVTGPGPWAMHYYNAPAGGFALALTIKASAPLVLGVAAHYDGLPELPGPAFTPRPPDMAPAYDLDSSTIVARTFHIDPP